MFHHHPAVTVEEAHTHSLAASKGTHMATIEV